MMTKKIPHLTVFAAFIFFCSLTTLRGQDSDFEWAINIGGIGSDYGNGVAVDGNGNVFVTGYFNGAADFNPLGGGDTLIPVGGTSDVFIAKYDANSNYLWAINMGSAGLDIGYAVATDSMGNVYVTGGFGGVIGGTADFDPGAGSAMITSAGHYDIFVAKYDPDGNYLWAIGMGSSGVDVGRGIAVDRNGNVYVTGYFNSSVDFDPGTGTTTITSAGGGGDVFVAKYDTDGNYLWAKSMGGNSFDIGEGIALDSTDNVYVTGYFGGSANFNPGGSGGALNSLGSYDVFLAKFDTAGNYLWAKSMGGQGEDQGYGVAVGRTGSVYITGTFVGSANFNPVGGGSALTSLGSYSLFLAKYDSGGNYLWAVSAEGTSTDNSYAVAVDGSDNVYITGTFFSPTLNFNPGGSGGTLANAGNSDVFLAKYDPAGNYLWAKGMGGPGQSGIGEAGRGVAVDGSGNVYITGEFNSVPADFNPGGTGGILTPILSWDAFIVKFSCSDTSSFYIVDSAECGNSYTLNGEIYTSSGTYTQVFSNKSGCDSTVILDLTFHQIEQPVISIDTFVLGVAGTYTTYQWIKDGTDIPGATDSTYTVTENGSYQVRVTDENGCEVTSAVYEVDNVSIDKAKGVEEYINIYPNPVNEVIYINSPVNINVSLSSIEGRNVLYVENAKTVPVRTLAKGIYLLRIMDNTGRLIKVEKIVKE